MSAGLIAMTLLVGGCEGGSQKPSEAFCSDLRSGLTPMNLWDRDEDPGDFADRAYGMAAISCPEQLENNEVLRTWLQRWDIDPDA